MTRKRPITSSTEGTEEPGKGGREVGSARNGLQHPPSPLGGSLGVPSTKASQRGPHFSQPRGSLKGSSSPGAPPPVGGGLCRGPKGLACTPSLTAPEAPLEFQGWACRN